MKVSPIDKTLFGRRAFLMALAFAAAVLHSGCSVMWALESDPGTDLSSVKAGATREQVEALVGAPQREWPTRTGVRYCLYRYDPGFGPHLPGAATMLFMDAASLGMWELITINSSPEEFRGPRQYALMAVSYDSKNVVVGVFRDVGEFTAFPEDGRPVAATGPGAHSTAR